MNWVGVELTSAATAAFLEKRLYLRLEEIAKKGTMVVQISPGLLY
jgi:hypothetical protein